MTYLSSQWQLIRLVWRQYAWWYRVGVVLLAATWVFFLSLTEGGTFVVVALTTAGFMLLLGPLIVPTTLYRALGCNRRTAAANRALSVLPVLLVWGVVCLLCTPPGTRGVALIGPVLTAAYFVCFPLTRLTVEPINGYGIVRVPFGGSFLARVYWNPRALLGLGLGVVSGLVYMAAARWLEGVGQVYAQAALPFLAVFLITGLFNWDTTHARVAQAYGLPRHRPLLHHAGSAFLGHGLFAFSAVGILAGRLAIDPVTHYSLADATHLHLLTATIGNLVVLTTPSAGRLQSYLGVLGGYGLSVGFLIAVTDDGSGPGTSFLPGALVANLVVFSPVVLVMIWTMITYLRGRDIQLLRASRQH